MLLIEDNVTQLDLYALTLESDFAVLTATRGEAGYTAALTHRPDAIVVDVLLPDVDGLGLCVRLRSNASTAGIPIIVLTGDEGSFARAEPMRGLDAVLRKPCPADVLIGVLRRAMSVRAIR